MKKKVLIASILLGLFGLMVSGANAVEDKLTAFKDVTAQDVKVQSTVYQGRPALKVELNDALQQRVLNRQGSNQPAFALLPVDFQNGTIEVDIAAELNGKGVPDARAFAGIAFHIPPDFSTYKALYLRMTNGRLAQPTPTEPRISRAIQYTAHPDFHWEVSRKNFPGKYESGANIAPATWIRFRLEISGSQVKAYVNDEKEPALTVEDMKLGNRVGKIGLWVDDGTAAYFSDIKIEKK
jgi:hypothetical protein